MTRLLMITPARAPGAIGGREQLSALHERCLGELLGDALSVQRLARGPAKGVRSLADALVGRIDGVTQASEVEVVRRVVDGAFDWLWVDGSNLGRLAAAVRRAAPATKVATFCHNVEARFFFGGLHHRPGPRAAAVLAANFAAERLAVRHSHRLVVLSARDSALFDQVYGRSATDLLPLAIEDRRPVAAVSDNAPSGLLFVGGAFYANVEGMRWFAREVAPHITMPLTVVGRGFDAHRQELERPGQITVVGAAGELAQFYAAARAVIAPIFDGSGMKTKVAEALMFGTPVIGTREAFSGYENIAAKAGWRADSAEEWVAAIGKLAGEIPPAFDPALRALYEVHFSGEAAKRGIAKIIGLD